MKGLLSFKNGVHPPENKDITAGIASRRFPFSDEIILPLSQHIGTPAKALVKPGYRYRARCQNLHLHPLQVLQARELPLPPRQAQVYQPPVP